MVPEVHSNALVVMDNDYTRNQCRRDKYKVNGRWRRTQSSDINLAQTADSGRAVNEQDVQGGHAKNKTGKAGNMK